MDDARPAPGWHNSPDAKSLAEVNASIAVPGRSAGFWRKLMAFAGPGFLVSVGYMDPGNWATDIAGGAKFGYALLSVVLISNLIAIVLQALAARLGIVCGRDLAQACRDAFPRPVGYGLWFLAEIAICATDLAEFIGTAIALKLLFHIPLIYGVLLTALDALLILWLQNHGFRWVEALVVGLIAIIGGCFAYNIALASPEWGPLVAGFIPSTEVFRNPQMLYIAIGILGATVMPHNLYLHSAVVQTRKYGHSSADKAEAVRFATIDSTVALSFALFINAAILILSAAARFHVGHSEVDSIEVAYQLLQTPGFGATAAAILFAVALLACGSNSTVTATLAGQVVMEGFLSIRLPAWMRRLITRLLALIPAVLVIGIKGESSTLSLLVISQVVLSLQLPFAVIPLLLFSSDRRKMGEFRPGLWLLALAWLAAVFIVVLNVKLLWDIAAGWLGAS